MLGGDWRAQRADKRERLAEKERLSHAQDSKAKSYAEEQAWEREKHQRHIDSINALKDELATQRNESRAEDGKKAFREYLTIFLVFCALLSSIGGDLIYYRTMKDARRAVKKAHVDAVSAINSANLASNNSIGAANRAAQNQHSDTIAAINRAAEANTINKETARRQLRAYLVPAEVKFSDFDEYKVPRITISINNSGITPAYNVRRIMHVDILDVPIKDEPWQPFNAAIAKLKKQYLGKGIQMFVTGERALTKTDIELVKDGISKRLYGHGRIYYDDIFDQHHTLDFC